VGIGPKPKHQVHVCSLDTHGLKMILYSILGNFVHKTKFYSVEFPTCGVMLILKRVPILEDFRFQNATLGILTLYFKRIRFPPQKPTLT
jgi:hypothetical protein